jgi:hypothetical protein
MPEGDEGEGEDSREEEDQQDGDDEGPVTQDDRDRHYP